MSGLFSGIIANVSTIYRGRNLLWQSIAVAATAMIVLSGLDWAYFEASRSEVLRMVIFPAIVIGGLLPIVLPISILAIGYMRRSSLIRLHAWAIAQAALLGYLVSTTYKAFTGRIPPAFAETVSANDTSHGFQFGFLRGGVFWGWPSSHTTVAFAMAACVAALFPERKATRALAYLYAAYVAFGVSVSIHWLSEAVAGVIFGTVIGLVVGESFRSVRASKASDAASHPIA